MNGAGAGPLLPVAAAVVLAGAAAVAVPVAATDWALAGAILGAALAQSEIARRKHTVRHGSESSTAAATTSVWSLAAAVAVHLTPAIAVVVVLCAYRSLRGRHESTDVLATAARDAGTIAWALAAAHFTASSGEWATSSPQATTAGVLTVAAAGLAHLAVTHALAGLRYGRVSEVGLEAALLTIGAIVGVLATGEPLVVLAAIPVVVTLHGATLTRQLEDDAFVDQKTGLATAASWQADADRAFADAVRDGRPVGVLMVDLDHFKRLNDTYGHHAGDDVLTEVGACLRAQLRHGDLSGRFGGEEFTVLLPDAATTDLMAAAERVRTAIAALRVTTVDNHGRPTVITGVTASIGVATHPHDGATLQECLRTADCHVYEAKQQGRNTVVGIDVENLTGYEVPEPRRTADAPGGGTVHRPPRTWLAGRRARPRRDG